MVGEETFIKSIEETYELLPDPLLLLDSERNILYANSAFYRYFKRNRENTAVGMKCYDVARMNICKNQCILKSAEAEFHETARRYNVICSTRGVGPVCLTCRILESSDGKKGSPYALELFKDMHDLGNYMEKLRASSIALEQEKEKLSTILDSIADGYFVAGKDHTVTNVSDGLLMLLEKKRDEVVGKPCSIIFHSDKCRTDCPLAWTLKNREHISNCKERILTGKDEIRNVLKSTYLLRDPNSEVTGVIGIVRDNTEFEELKKRASSIVKAHGFVSQSPQMHRTLELLETIKDTDTSVLILGESGTGKEMLANAIVRGSIRAKKPFIKINCSALTENLLESELFGHVKGSFTGAVADKPGKFELADGGTILLDEVGDMSLPLQSKVLRVLQEKEFERVGGNKTKRVDVRVIAATNKDLKEEISAGNFREDLYYRLHVIPVIIPPLRERTEDIPLLVNHFMDIFNQKYGKTIEEVSSRAMHLLINYPWPGNIRELRNAIEYAFVCTNGSVIERVALPDELRKFGAALPPSASYQPAGKSLSRGGEADEPEADSRLRAELVMTLESVDGNRARAAKALGISRTTLWRKMKALGIEEKYG